MCVLAGCPVRTDGCRGYVNTSACLGHCVSSFFSPTTCFHSASADDLGSNLFNFVCWLENLLDRSFFEILVRCLHSWFRPTNLSGSHLLCSFLVSPIFFVSSSELCPLALFQNLTRPCGRAQWTALMPSGTLSFVEHAVSWTCRCFVLDVVRCFWGSPWACEWRWSSTCTAFTIGK